MVQYSKNAPKLGEEEKGEAQRREFLKKCGKYAVVMPPVVALLLSGTSTRALASTTDDIGGRR